MPDHSKLWDGAWPHANSCAVLQGAQQAKTGAALKKLQELQAAEAAPLDEREIQIAGIEVRSLPCAMLGTSAPKKGYLSTGPPHYL